MKENDGKKRTPTGTMRATGFTLLALALGLLYYINVVLPESALVMGRGRKARAGLGSSRAAPPPRMMTQAEVDTIVAQGPPSGIETPDKPPRAPNTAICNESVLEGVMSVARQQTDRAVYMYEQERKRREDQDKQLETAQRRAEELERLNGKLKADLEAATAKKA